MVLLRAREVKGVEWLVNHDRVSTIAPGAHHGSRDIARAGPHRETEKLHNGTFGNDEALGKPARRELWTSPGREGDNQISHSASHFFVGQTPHSTTPVVMQMTRITRRRHHTGDAPVRQNPFEKKLRQER